MKGFVASAVTAENTTPHPQPSTDRRHRGRSANANTRPSHQPKQPKNGPWGHRESCVFAPRPYEEIYSERAYLSLAMQAYSSKLASYIHEYSTLQIKLQQGAKGNARRKLRKKTGLMRTRISEASQQERAIFNRLADLFLELHSRDIWNAACLEGANWLQTTEPRIESPCISVSNSAASDCSTPSLNAESPVFVPQDKPHGYHGGSREHRRVRSLETVPELVQEEEEDEEEEDRASLAGGQVGGEVSGDYGPLAEDTSNAAKEQLACNTTDSHDLQKEPSDNRWRYVHVLADDEDITDGELGSKRWSLPVMRYTWPA